MQGAGLDQVFHDIVSNIGHLTASETKAARDVIDDTASGSHVPSARKVIVKSCQPADKMHACAMCPAALCKGLYVRAFLPYHPRILFCCDGANDLCGVLCLREGDTALVREGYKCSDLLRQRLEMGAAAVQPVCHIEHWSTQDELAALIRQQLC